MTITIVSVHSVHIIIEHVRNTDSNRSSAFLAHLSHWLMVSYCERWRSVVRRRPLPTIASKDTS